MTCGYVENAQVSALIYQCQFFDNPGYSTYKEAITDLALDLYAKFYEDFLSAYQNRYSSNDKCCRDVLIADKDAHYCPKCGKRITDKEFNYEEFQSYIVNLHGSTCESYGDAEDAGDRVLTWWPFWINDFIGAPKEEVIHLQEYAELILLAALLDAKPELKNKDSENYMNDYGCEKWEQYKNK